MEASKHLSEGSFRVTFPGPFTHHDVVVDGWQVPLIEAELQGEDRVVLILDRRFGVELSADEAERVVPFLAHAISVALGFASHPQRDTEPPLGTLPSPRPRRAWNIAAAEQEPTDKHNLKQ